jgi:GAF domain-containing protein
MTPVRPTLDAVVRAAMEASAADRGWLLELVGDEFVVAAAADASGGNVGGLLGERRACRGTAGFVAQSGQPAAVRLRADDEANAGAGGASGVPAAVLAAPCVDASSADAAVVGVLELVRSDGGFGFDDVETVAWLTDIAGAALAEGGAVVVPPSPQHLALALEQLAATDPRRYADVARLVAALL